MSGHHGKPAAPRPQRRPKPGALRTATLIDAESGEQIVAPLDRKSLAPVEGGTGIAAVFAGGAKVALRPDAKLLDEGIIDPPCPACGCKHLYVQRDFNRALGVGIVAGAALVGAIWSGMQGTIYPLLGMLAASTLFDAVVYSLLPPVVVCYRCLTCYRGVEPGDDVVDYDQGIADAYAFSGGVLGTGFKHGEQ